MYAYFTYLPFTSRTKISVSHAKKKSINIYCVSHSAAPESLVREK